ncbi:MAG: hypothetical protein A2117_02575 [Candidatus Wildermuthbacteria bacterium GWA2_46_15]|uniref:Proline--tRNA ligase n=1 Tax=Candidatus Wildermuthbacteria bacterium GWA2_46_15 TaxID=1802443 RepID=A0A1G2QSQ5_9BACT|nr:MAG: hypothetical protein A2117_02575 [Candidatus Wildermuthbacteria bacterium GWA2_46_15]
MRQSNLFGKTLREAPKDETTINAKLLIRAGFINKLTAGVYTYLPLGWRVIRKIENIIREEMEKVGGQELVMPVLHPKESWQITDRWDTVDVLFKLEGWESKELALGPTHEEVVTPLVKKHIQTYKDLPLYLFQIQTKFRKEKRAKSGLIRNREFLMKDLYSFHKSEADLDEYYEKMKEVYWRIFKKVGIGNETYLTFASGGTFSKFSHEFQTPAEAGEDVIYICQECRQAINQEIRPEVKNCPNCQAKQFKETKAIEVGNIFKLKTKFSESFDLYFVDKHGTKGLVQMGCYGIGLGRLMGTIVEVFHDDKGIIWPKAVAPFSAHLLQLGNESKIKAAAEKLYGRLKKQGVEVLFDDRQDKTPGEKFADADLIGIPLRVVVSEKSLAQKSFEFKNRNEKKIELVPVDKSLTRIKS